MFDAYAYPSALWLLMLIPAFLVWYLGYYSRRQPRIALSLDPDEENPSASGMQVWGVWLRYLPLLAWLAAALFLVLALARPQQTRGRTAIQEQGVAWMLLLDVSRSMQQPDVLPSRFEAMRRSALRLLATRPHDQVGIILFAQDALTWVPPTNDHHLLRHYLQMMRPGVLPYEGTALGDALALGLTQLEPLAARGKAMVLFSDGAGNTGPFPPRAAAGLLTARGIRLMAVALGQAALARQAHTNPPNSQQMKTDFDGQGLQHMAEQTGGTYLHLLQAEGSLTPVQQALDRLPTGPLPVTLLRNTVERFPVCVAAALGCILVALLSMLGSLSNPLEG